MLMVQLILVVVSAVMCLVSTRLILDLVREHVQFKDKLPPTPTMPEFLVLDPVDFTFRVERMNGTIRVESHLGRSSSFTILIPALSGFEDADAGVAADDYHSGHPQKHSVLYDSDSVV